MPSHISTQRWPAVLQLLEAAACLAVLLWQMQGAVAATAGGAAQHLNLVWGVYIEMSTGKTIPLDWSAGVVDYSLALPYDAPLMAVRVAVARGETPEEEGPFAEGGGLALSVPLMKLRYTLLPGKPSEYLNISTDQASLLQLEIVGVTYAIRVIRSRIASNGQGIHPDPARLYPPTGTLAGLAVWDSMGRNANMAWFTPRTSFFQAAVSKEAHDVRLVATPNDPDAELEWRRNGGKWDNLVSGLTSSPAKVTSSGWTLFEVRVRSAEAQNAKAGMHPLIYQIAVTKERVCHPKCRSCSGPGFEDCLSCFAPLVLFNGKCLYTSCQAVGKYFDPDRELCFNCYPTCAECQDATPRGCILCPPLRYLLVASELDIAGECVVTCPFGYFVQPTSQRCKRAPPSIRVEKFYVLLKLRVTVDEFEERTNLLQTVLRVSAETLAVSPQDVRFHRWDEADKGLSVHYYLEVENPFLKHRDVEERIKIDEWFAALPVPVDGVHALSHSQLYPPPVQPLEEPFIKPWMWGAFFAGVVTVCIVYPMYQCYFIRKHFSKSPYRPKQDNQDQFVEEVVLSARPGDLNKLLHRSVK